MSRRTSPSYRTGHKPMVKYPGSQYASEYNNDSQSTRHEDLSDHLNYYQSTGLTNRPSIRAGRNFFNTADRQVNRSELARKQLIGEGWMEHRKDKKTAHLYDMPRDDDRDSGRSDWGRLGLAWDEFKQLNEPLTERDLKQAHALMEQRIALALPTHGSKRLNMLRDDLDMDLLTDVYTRDMVENPREYLEDVLLHKNVYINDSRLQRAGSSGTYIDTHPEIIPNLPPIQYPETYGQELGEMLYDELRRDGRTSAPEVRNSYAGGRSISGYKREVPMRESLFY